MLRVFLKPTGYNLTYNKVPISFYLKKRVKEVIKLDFYTSPAIYNRISTTVQNQITNIGSITNGIFSDSVKSVLFFEITTAYINIADMFLDMYMNYNDCSKITNEVIDEIKSDFVDLEIKLLKEQSKITAESIRKLEIFFDETFANRRSLYKTQYKTDGKKLNMDFEPWILANMIDIIFEKLDSQDVDISDKLIEIIENSASDFCNYFYALEYTQEYKQKSFKKIHSDSFNQNESTADAKLTSAEDFVKKALSLSMHFCLDDSVWKDFGYKKRPRRGSWFNRFIKEDILKKEIFLLRELFICCISTCILTLNDSYSFEFKMKIAARMIEKLLSLDGIISAYSFSNCDDAAKYFINGIKHYHTDKNIVHVFTNRAQIILKESIEPIWFLGIAQVSMLVSPCAKSLLEEYFSHILEDDILLAGHQILDEFLGFL